eukprot:TRINITY_DN99_c0_g1_i1.p2 TRINITY_DN99_c0_g1~~TRINITY_DN99_c0_g1_i1.p2  ORF type:complete len:150 (+),score=34.72 TRINITY_DN99_c0_g1_i1:44-493(+)
MFSQIKTVKDLKVPHRRLSDVERAQITAALGENVYTNVTTEETRFQIAEQEIVIPKGFLTDLCSPPAVPDDDADHCIMHDYLYGSHAVDRKTADRVLTPFRAFGLFLSPQARQAYKQGVVDVMQDDDQVTRIFPDGRRLSQSLRPPAAA